MAISSCKWLLSVILSFLLSLPVRPYGNKVISRHPFYVSVTEIAQNSKENILEISCKMFTNDFESSLEKFSRLKIDLSDPKTKGTADKYISDYISKHLHLKIDNIPVILQWVGMEKEAEATWSYFQVNNVHAIKRIDISNSLLYESFSSEINIMHVSVNGNRKSTKLNNPDTEASFEF
jgi:hypothetical protein